MFPIVSNAKDEEWTRWDTLNDEVYCADNSIRDVYGTEVSYVDGKYHIEGTVNTELVWNWSLPLANANYNYVYTCKQGNVTECENVYLVFKNVRCHGFNNRVGVKFVGGATYETQPSFYIGDGYKYEKGVYTLTNPEAHDFLEMTSESYISDTYTYKYLCEGYGKTCKKAWILFSVINPLTGGRYLAGVDVEDYYLMSDQFVIENDQYLLIEPKKVYPTLEGGFGYSCHNHETACTTLYRLTIDDDYDNHDGKRAVYDLLTINNHEKSKVVNLRARGVVAGFFTEKELKQSFSTNSDVADVESDGVVLYKVGKTDLIYEDYTTYKVMHLTVEDSMIDNNPNTSNNIILVLIGSVIVFAFAYSRMKMNHFKSK